MKKHLVKSKRRERRRRRSKGNTLGTKLRPRLVVYRSLSHIYAQLIDDIERKTLVAASSTEKDFIGSKKGTKTELSTEVGKELAGRAKKIKVSKVVFDRNGFLYHGRVKAFADGAREGGLEF